ncbi:MAG: hypothetical protein ACXVXP_09440, partial [Mycobacteriaceae bacterium]
MTSPEWEAANEDDSDRFPQTLQESASESTESHERGSRVVPDPARVARYAEAMHASTCDVTRKPPCPVDGYLAWRRWAEAAMAVADEERASLVAEVERLSSNLSDLLCELTGGRLSKTNYDVRTMVREVEAYFEEFAEED